jgi:hypothetical protein
MVSVRDVEGWNISTLTYSRESENIHSVPVNISTLTMKKRIYLRGLLADKNK